MLTHNSVRAESPPRESSAKVLPCHDCRPRSSKQDGLCSFAFCADLAGRLPLTALPCCLPISLDMTLDLPTLVVTLLLGYLLLSLELWVALGSKRQGEGLRAWTQGSWFIMAGLCALMARRFLPVPLTVVLGNTLILLGFIFYAQALSQFLLHRSAPRWVWLSMLPAVLILTLVSTWPQAARSVVVPLLYVMVLLPSVYLVCRHGLTAERSLRTVGLTLGLTLLAMLMRSVHSWLAPDEYGGMHQVSLAQGLIFLMAYLSMIGAGFGFVLASFERAAHQMEQLATLDGLTGCFNRSTTDAMLVHELASAQRDLHAVSFVVLDLDHFKHINDAHGHAAGDAVLRSFASTVKQRLRACDVLGRLGGEEFGLVLPNTDAYGAHLVAEGVLRAVETMPVLSPDGVAIRVTVSAGVATALPQAGFNGEALYRAADRALYRAKELGRNQVVSADPASPLPMPVKAA